MHQFQKPPKASGNIHHKQKLLTSNDYEPLKSFGNDKGKYVQLLQHLNSLKSEYQRKIDYLKNLQKEKEVVNRVAQKEVKIDKQVTKLQLESRILLKKGKTMTKFNSATKPVRDYSSPRRNQYVIPTSETFNLTTGSSAAVLTYDSDQSRRTALGSASAGSAGKQHQYSRSISPSKQKIQFTEFHEKGMASEVFNTEFLLKRKEILIQKISQTFEMKESALLYREQLEHMHYQVREQRNHDRSRVSEVLPYFDFQSKIEAVLLRIRQKNELRMRVQDSRIKVAKNQAKDYKSAITHNLREKVNELVEQEMENKSTKLKMVAGQRRKDETSTHSTSNQMKTLKINSAGLALNSGSGRKCSEIPSSAGLKHTTDLAVTSTNYPHFKQLSDHIELCLLLQKYFQEQNLQPFQSQMEITQMVYSHDMQHVRDQLKQRCAEMLREREKELKLLGLVIRAGESQHIRRRHQHRKEKSTFAMHKIPPTVTISNPEGKSHSESRNLKAHNLSSQSTQQRESKRSLGTSVEVHQTNTDLDQQAYQLHLKLFSQVDHDEMLIDELVIQTRYETVMIRHSMLLKDYDELNKIKMQRENHLNKFRKELFFLKQALGIMHDVDEIPQLAMKNESQVFYIDENDYSLQSSKFQKTQIDDIETETKPEDNQDDIKDVYNLQQNAVQFMSFQFALAKVKQNVERIKMCLNEHCNAYAFKMSMIKDVSNIKMDDNIESVLQKFKAIWPFLPQDFLKEVKQGTANNAFSNKMTNVFKKKYGGDSDSSKYMNMDLTMGGSPAHSNTLANRTYSFKKSGSNVLDDEAAAGQLSNRKLKELIKDEEHKIQKKKSSFGVMLFQKNFQKIIQQRIEIPILFSTILDFMKFLTRQLSISKMSKSLPPIDASSQVSQQSKNDQKSLGSLLADLKKQKQTNEAVVVAIVNEVGSEFDMNKTRATNDLADVKQRDFQGKYIRFMAHNDQNLHQIMRKQRKDQQENQNGMQSTQEIVIEDKHISEIYLQEKQNLQLRLKSKKGGGPKKSNHQNYHMKATMASSNMVNQINHDKCMYSKLITFERQESIFVTKFLKKFEEAQTKLTQSLDTEIKENLSQNHYNLPTEQNDYKPKTAKVNLSQTMKPPKVTNKDQMNLASQKSALQLKSQTTNGKVSFSKGNSQSQSKANSPRTQQALQSQMNQSKIMIQNMTIDQINSKETLSQIKNLIRAQSASGARTANFQTHFINNSTITPKDAQINISMQFGLNDKSKVRQSFASTSAQSQSCFGQKKYSLENQKQIPAMNRTSTKFNL